MFKYIVIQTFRDTNTLARPHGVPDFISFNIYISAFSEQEVSANRPFSHYNRVDDHLGIFQLARHLGAWTRHLGAIYIFIITNKLE